jgi:UDP:flavonoid glycosyltransferase YjiC (YdhE family)
LDDGPPPIVFTLGSTAAFDNSSFSLQSILAANMLGRRAVLLGSTSGHTFPNNANVISVGYAPHGEVFKRAAVIVHHGGIGTTAAAMRAGCPMLVLPGFSWDQPDNAARATDLGVARMLLPHEYNAFSAACELAHLLYNPTYPLKSAEVGCVIQAEDGVGSACDEIERS